MKMSLGMLMMVMVLAISHTGLAADNAKGGQRGDAKVGKSKSVLCAACHGAQGIGTTPMYPNLAGQKEQYLISTLKAFRAGDRQNKLMNPMASALSDRDIENLAAYYSSLSPTGGSE